MLQLRLQRDDLTKMIASQRAPKHVLLLPLSTCSRTVAIGCAGGQRHHGRAAAIGCASIVKPTHVAGATSLPSSLTHAHMDPAQAVMAISRPRYFQFMGTWLSCYKKCMSEGGGRVRSSCRLERSASAPPLQPTPSPAQALV